jgi:hypothetical protein
MSNTQLLTQAAMAKGVSAKAVKISLLRSIQLLITTEKNYRCPNYTTIDELKECFSTVSNLKLR